MLVQINIALYIDITISISKQNLELVLKLKHQQISEKKAQLINIFGDASINIKF